MHKISFRKMKSPHFLVFPFLFAAFLSLLWATSAHAHESFLHCLSLRSENSSFISKIIYTQNNSSYSSILEFSMHNLRFSTSTIPKPQVIITPFHTSHVQATIYCSKKHGLQIRTRSGGHDFEGLSYVSEVPFVIIDLINFRSVDIDVENKIAWVQSGVVLGELYYRIAEKSKTLAFPAGICHTVGLGGYFSGGGYGLLFRKYGLAADNIVDAQFIDVNGRILDRKAMGEDLFWAIRGGGGGSFGIVIAWKLKLVPVPATVTAFSISRTSEQNAIKLVHRWQYIAHKLPDETFSLVVLSSVNSSQDGKKTILASFRLFFLGGVDELVPLMQERFPELGLVKEDCTEMSWIESILYFGQIQNKSLDILLDRTFQSPLISPAFKAKSDYVKEPIPEIALEGLWSKLYEEEAKSAGLVFVAYGGIMDEIPETATPFPHRAGNLYKILYTVGWQKEDNKSSQKYISWIRRVYSYMSSFVSQSPREAYINYRDLDIGINSKGNTSYAQASIWGHKYFKNNFDKLLRVKTMIDPKNFFRHEQSIPPLLSGWKKRGK
ncbi:berberine bridge enzyme-like 18 [Herrania umbratica]|uniref:Berberine bridge enzyme-like 18 n=1 Tax=Herrania umbratica TaxID=108875 RepID=A0A6J1AI38_9ROSI|nr:berberine bridge enzyme-like 18 [Herrania umbratica]